MTQKALREYLNSTHRSIRKKESIQTSSYRRSLKYFVLFGKNTKFLCSLDWKFPEFFKTHRTFICSSLFRASRSLWTLTSVFFGTPCSHVSIIVIHSPIVHKMFNRWLYHLNVLAIVQRNCHFRVNFQYKSKISKVILSQVKVIKV